RSTRSEVSRRTSPTTVESRCRRHRVRARSVSARLRARSRGSACPRSLEQQPRGHPRRQLRQLLRPRGSWLKLFSWWTSSTAPRVSARFSARAPTSSSPSCGNWRACCRRVWPTKTPSLRRRSTRSYASTSGRIEAGGPTHTLASTLEVARGLVQVDYRRMAEAERSAEQLRSAGLRDRGDGAAGRRDRAAAAGRQCTVESDHRGAGRPQVPVLRWFALLGVARQQARRGLRRAR